MPLFYDSVDVEDVKKYLWLDVSFLLNTISILSSPKSNENSLNSGGWYGTKAKLLLFLQKYIKEYIKMIF